MNFGESFSTRISVCSKGKRSNIILALDPLRRFDLSNYLFETIKLLEPHLCAIKFNFHVIMPLGYSEMGKITRICHSYGLQVIADIKLNDIPATNNLALEYLVDEGFDAVIASPIIGKSELIELVEKAHHLGVGIIALVYMSHPGASQTYGIQVVDDNRMFASQPVPLYEVLLRNAKEAHVDGIVVGATRPDIIKDISSRKPAPIYSPGVGLQGGNIMDASKNGVDYFIIGRSIIESEHPLKTLYSLNERIKCF
ncbi:MAG TPA: orotidine 5'-phosphate decarboxylase [Nitrososphaeraceae archaeon]|nr:orotidine 5'-phosphate decarboxylase [Nitrososphaeraceae archaeon]